MIISKYNLFVLVYFFSLLLIVPLSEAADIEQCKTAMPYVEEANKLIGREPIKAESLYREALKKCPESANISYNLGISLYSQGKISEAVEVFKKIIQADTEHRDAMRMLAYVLVKENIDTARGRALAERLLSQDANDVAARRIVMIALTDTPSTPSPTAVSDVDLEIPVTGTINPNAIAVVIGNSEYYDKDIPSVDYALNDARVVKEYLIKVLGYKEGNIIYQPNMTKVKFEAIFGTRDNYKGRLYQYLKSGKSDIFIYYAGHGAPDTQSRQGYFIPVDADPQAISLTGYSLQTLYDNVEVIAKEMKTQNVFIVIDSCFSGMTEKGMLLKNVSPIDIVIENPIMTIPNAVVMTSSGNSEVSSWYPEKGHSMFTYFFLKTLKDKAGKPDGAVTIGEIFGALSDSSEGVPYYARRLHGRIQTPQITGDVNKVILRR